MSNIVTRPLTPDPASHGGRGPVEHERRDQILEAAHSHFRTYGYVKTTVADLARAIGLSAAYIYKFFESKQAIGEAVCRQALGRIADELREIAHQPKPAATRLRLVFQTVARRGAELCFTDRKLHDLAVTACAEKWQPIRDHQAALLEIVRGLVVAGRESGEFERKTPIAETSQAILQTLELFSQPLLLEQNIDDPEGRAESVANLVLRSLAP
jgi:AcrR family transcriptional regulator